MQDHTEAVSTTDTNPASHHPDKRLHVRCGCCNRKAGTMGFRCKCGKMFCSRHRLPEDHGCTYDHKASGRQHIADANPKVVAPKVVEV